MEEGQATCYRRSCQVYSMILVPVRVLGVLQIYLDLIVHLFIDIFATGTSNDTHNAKRA